MYEMVFAYTVDENQNTLTLLEGRLPDHADLNYVYDLKLPLMSVQVLK